MISGKTTLIAHLGYPTEAFKAPMIYNPWFDQKGIDAVVMPMGVQVDDYPAMLAALSRVTNLKGALVTMPHKVSTLSLADELTPTARIAGACNALLKLPDGRWRGDQFDGEGFVRGLLRKGRPLKGVRVLVTGCGGVGSAIAASLAAAGVGHISLFDRLASSAEGLADRLQQHYPQLTVRTGSDDPAEHDIVVNATPMGMNDNDPLPLDIDRIAPSTLVGEVVMKSEHTPLLKAALAKGCEVQVGTDMLFEMIPAYLEFFGFGTATADELRAVSQIRY
ncbi:shikimate dehydrogenase [Curvibacter sp. HBC61]|uniref:Shikimate dehydrogenase n=1 Tax=Curvibacter cyanobacteriorum TaxID=3026422 RepID=A0ABT5N234_9BURK|nr:shikimate dehydrogenase [Curvibacter sp. HBC61]MDD0839586.1 shikimate dehydrogenase [Curvibacter sp. HBC61]